ncbi:NACHT domain-containing protein [Streptomyces sp. NPDC056503]|uniref:NACHT domain-containing protein n=1 Tax=Streptomyces sp. NPDC056503 TaxID=3345842 RepID=UPI0036D14798
MSLLVVAVCALWALYGDGWAGSLERSTRIDTVAMVAGVCAALLALWALRRPPEAEPDVVARLARAVKAVGEPQWTEALGGDLTPIDVTFAFRPYGNAREPALPASPAGRLEKVVEDYRELRPRRLVITGEPGAGKTVLARKFVMELTRVRGEAEPVPVLVSLADWDAAESFEGWLVRHLQRDYGLRERSARAVVSARMVLPVLDGLDEMDATGATGLETRAARALEALSRHQDGTEPAPLVLTCRSAEYDALEAAGGHILDAARLEIAPVTADRAVAFLSARRGAVRRPAAWEPLLRELRDRPDGVRARALSTPWRLTLAAVAYEREGEPGESAGAGTEAEVADRLLGRFVGASLASAGNGDAPERVHRRLATLARALETEHGPDADLVLRELAGRLGGRTAKVLYGGCLGVVFTAFSVGAAAGWSGVGQAVFTMLFALVLLALAGTQLLARPPRALSFDFFVLPALGSPVWRVVWRTALRRAPLPVVVTGTLFAAMVGATSAPPAWGGLGLPHVALAESFLLGLLFCSGLMYRFDQAVLGPSGWARTGSAVGLAFALAALVFPGYEWTDGKKMVSALLTLYPLMTLTLLAFAGPWFLHLCVLAAHRPRLPLRLGSFLDRCVAAGLLRTSGAAYQFRHREFQEWLVRHPEPPPGP